MAERKSLLLHLDPAVHDALARWARDELCTPKTRITWRWPQAFPAMAGRTPPTSASTQGGGDRGRLQ